MYGFVCVDVHCVCMCTLALIVKEILCLKEIRVNHEFKMKLKIAFFLLIKKDKKKKKRTPNTKFQMYEKHQYISMCCIKRSTTDHLSKRSLLSSFVSVIC